MNTIYLSVRRVFTLATLLWIAFALRIYQLDSQPVWGDEAFSIQTAGYDLSRIVAGGTDTHPPLFHVVLHGWQIVAGQSIFSDRFLSLLAGWIMVASVYAIARRVARPYAARIALILVVVGPFGVYYSQEIRMYAQAGMASALSTWSFLNLIQMRQRTCWRWLYFLFTLLAMYTHYFTFFIIVAHNLYILWKWRSDKRSLAGWFSLQMGLAVAYVPWLLVQAGYLSGKTAAATKFWSLDGIVQILQKVLIAFGGGVSLSPLFYAGAWLFLLLAIVGIVALMRDRDENRSPDFIVFYLIVPIALALIAAPLWPFFNERFLIVAYPAFLIALAAALEMLSLSRLRQVVSYLLVAILLLNALSLINYFADPAYQKSGYRDLMQHIRDSSHAGDAIILLNPEQEALFTLYGVRELPVYRFPINWDDPTNQPVLTAMSGQSRLWLVEFGNASDWDFGGRLEAWLQEHAFRAYRGTFIDGALSLYTIGQTNPDHGIDVRFGDSIQLIGYGVSSELVSPGDAVQIALKWKTLAQMPVNYTIFTHIVDDQPRLWAQMDGPSSIPTTLWEMGDTTIDRFAILIDPSIPAGRYWLEIGWYDPVTLVRLPAFDTATGSLDDRILLMQIEVR